jgi:hypothetical protein
MWPQRGHMCAAHGASTGLARNDRTAPTYIRESPELDEVPGRRVSAQPKTTTSKVKMIGTQAGPSDRADRIRRAKDTNHPIPVKRRRRGVPASLRDTLFAVREPLKFTA